MSDVDVITTLVHSYARLLDRGDVDAVVALFKHSTWRSLPNGSILRGAAEVRPVYEGMMARDGGSRSKHLITNLSIEIDPGDTTASTGVLQEGAVTSPPGLPWRWSRTRSWAPGQAGRTHHQHRVDNDHTRFAPTRPAKSPKNRGSRD